MPNYRYICDSCGNEMVELQMMSEEPLKKCPKCGEEKLKRKIGSGMGIIFKGSGFYSTDYKNTKEKGEKNDTKGKDNTDSK